MLSFVAQRIVKGVIVLLAIIVLNFLFAEVAKQWYLELFPSRSIFG